MLQFNNNNNNKYFSAYRIVLCLTSQLLFGANLMLHAHSLQNMHKPLPRFPKIKYKHRRTPVTDTNYSKIYYAPKIVAKFLPKLTLLCALQPYRQQTGLHVDFPWRPLMSFLCDTAFLSSILSLPANTLSVLLDCWSASYRKALIPNVGVSVMCNNIQIYWTFEISIYGRIYWKYI